MGFQLRDCGEDGGHDDRLAFDSSFLSLSCIAFPVGLPLQGRGDRDINPFKIPYAQTRSPFRTMAGRVQNLHVGLVSAGLGGLTAAVAISRAGARVTVLEAAAELGEIGAGIQMTSNVSRFLIKWGVQRHHWRRPGLVRQCEHATD
jgi:hypothetical protein